jgi:hypothetical protein
MARPFDLKRLEMTGDAFPIAEQVEGGVAASFSISENGSVAYLRGTPSNETQLAWFDRERKQLLPIGPVGRYNNVDLSANGNMVAFDRENDIFLFDIDRNLISPFISHSAADVAPIWSPNSRTIAFSSSREPTGNARQQNPNAGNLYERAVGVVGEEKLLLKTDAGKYVTDWSRDYLIYISSGDIWALPVPVPVDPKPLRITETPFVESQARVSPDQRWIAYSSNDSEKGIAVYVQSFLEPGAKQQVSAGTMPRWSSDSRELFYIAPAPTTLADVSSGTLMSVSIGIAGRELQIGIPVPLFPIRGSFTVAHDGRFLLNVTSTDQTSAPITVIHNWGATLKKRQRF